MSNELMIKYNNFILESLEQLSEIFDELSNKRDFNRIEKMCEIESQFHLNVVQLYKTLFEIRKIKDENIS